MAFPGPITPVKIIRCGRNGIIQAGMTNYLKFPKDKVEEGRGFPGIYAIKAPPMLEFS